MALLCVRKPHPRSLESLQKSAWLLHDALEISWAWYLQSFQRRSTAGYLCEYIKSPQLFEIPLTSIYRYWSFSACTILLYNAANILLEGRLDIVQSDLALAKFCLDVLEICAPHDSMATRYLTLMFPLFNSLCDIHHRMLARVKTSIFMLLQVDPNTVSPPIPASKEELDPILQRLCGLLIDPFGRKHGIGRRVLNTDGTYSVFWWK
jgi:hypothetical protein